MIIGRHQANYFRSLKEQDLITPDQEFLLDQYKDQVKIFPDMKGVNSYIDRISKPKEPVLLTEKSITENFLNVFLKETGKEFIQDESTTLAAFKTFAFYFLKDERFFKSPLLRMTSKSTPTLDKGLCVIGGYGTGKSSILRCFWKLASGTSSSFGYYHALKVVEKYEMIIKAKNEAYNSQLDKFNTLMNTRTALFDDVKTEPVVNDFGVQKNLMRQILEKRDTNQCKTFITSNYKDGTSMNDPDKFEKAVDEFGELYGGRVYDRMFNFNMIEMDWGSFRR